MRLYLLKRLDGVDWDENAGFVIRAKNEAAARKLASEQSGDENPSHWDTERSNKSPWLNPKKSSCELLNPHGESGVILQDFHAG